MFFLTECVGGQCLTEFLLPMLYYFTDNKKECFITVKTVMM